MPNVPTLLDEHVTLKCECLDRIYLNGCVAKLQDPGQLASFLVAVRGERIPSYEVVGQMAHQLIAGIERMAEEKGIPVVHFERGQSKEAIAAPYFVEAERQGREQVVLIGIAQERTRAFRPVAKQQRQPGKFGVARVAVFVNFYYLYIWTRTGGAASSRSAATRPGRSGCGSTVTTGCSASSSAGASPTSRSTTASPGSPTPWRCSGSPTASVMPTSSATSTAGCTACPVPSVPRTAFVSGPAHKAAARTRTDRRRTYVAFSTFMQALSITPHRTHPLPATQTCQPTQQSHKGRNSS